VSVELPVRGINIALTILLVRLLPLTQYGLYSYFLSVATVMVAIVSSGVQVAYVRRQAYLIVASGDQDGALFVISLLTVLVMHLVAGTLFISAFGVTDLACAAMAYATTLSLVSLVLAHLQATRDLRRYARENIGRNMLSIAAVGCLALAGHLTAASVLWALTLAQALILATASDLLLHAFRTARLCRTTVRSLLAENGLLFVYYALVGLYSQVDLLILKRWSDATQLALYGVALRYQSLALLLLMPLVNSIRVFTSSPHIAGMATAERRYFSEWLHKVAIIGLPVLVMGELLTPWLLPAVSGAAYAGAVHVFQLLLLGAFVSYLFAPANSLVIGRSGYRVLAFAGAAALACRTAGAWIAASAGSVVAIAGSAVVATLVLNLLPSAYLAAVAWRCDARSA
jgi:O-antigen/teichoic acid export membrane protein